MVKEISAAKTRLIELLNEFTSSEGMISSSIEHVKIMRMNGSVERRSVVYEPSIVIVAQGLKRGYLGEQSFQYDAHNYLVLSVPLPFECEVEATAEEPFLGLSVKVDPGVVAELLVELDDDVSNSPNTTPTAIYATPLNDDLLDASIRLLECLKNPREARILAPQIVREITFRVLCGEQGDALRALALQRSNLAKIAKSLKRIHSDYTRDLDVKTLAQEVGMSVSTFHHNFKLITSTAPLQYIKTIRLHKARMMMVQDGIKANSAASKVGYESASQFSREFKRLFGSTPQEEVSRMRERLGQPEVLGAIAVNS